MMNEEICIRRFEKFMEKEHIKLKDILHKDFEKWKKKYPKKYTRRFQCCIENPTPSFCP